MEPTRRALSVVGAYIDLNPVRAGIVEDPKDYRFSGYGEAVGQGKPEGHVLLRWLVVLGSGVHGLGVEGSDAGGGGEEGSVRAGAGAKDVSAAETRGSCGVAGGSGGWDSGEGRGAAPSRLRRDPRSACALSGGDRGQVPSRLRRHSRSPCPLSSGSRGQVPSRLRRHSRSPCPLSSGSRGQECPLSGEGRGQVPSRLRRHSRSPCPLSVDDLRAEARGYRKLLYGEAARTRRGGGAVVELEKAWAVEREGGKLALAQLLRCRVRYLTDGAVIGGKTWMEDWLRTNPETYGKRKTPPRVMRGGVWGGLCSLRDLRRLRGNGS